MRCLIENILIFVFVLFAIYSLLGGHTRATSQASDGSDQADVHHQASSTSLPYTPYISRLSHPGGTGTTIGQRHVVGMTPLKGGYFGG